MKKYKLQRNKNELTGLIGKEKMDILSNVVGEIKWNEYRKKWDRATNLENFKYPPQIDFELNGTCNLKCPMCPMGELDYRQNRDRLLEFDTYKKIIDDGIKKGLKSINLSYVNEPLIRDDLPKFIKYARDIGIADVYLSSNGILLKESNIKDLINSGLTRIQISLDAIFPETYNKIRIGGIFKGLIKILKNY